MGSSAAANAAFVGTVYQEALGRAADPAGAQGWTGLLGAGSLTPAQLLVDFIQSPEAQARDGTPVTNFLLAAGNGAASYGGNLFGIPQLTADPTAMRNDFTAAANPAVASRDGSSPYTATAMDTSGGVTVPSSATDPVFDLSSIIRMSLGSVDPQLYTT